MGDKLKKVLKITLITYMSLSFISGLFWFWFGGNLNFFGETGTHYDFIDFLSGSLFSFLFMCPVFNSIILFFNKKWKSAILFLFFEAINWVLVFGLQIFC